MAIRHLGRGRIVYQPVIFQGVLPADEKSAAALFTLAEKSPEPIPVVAQMDVLRLRRGLRLLAQSQAVSNVVGGVNRWDPSRNEPRLGQAPAAIESKADNPALPR